MHGAGRVNVFNTHFRYRLCEGVYLSREESDRFLLATKPFGHVLTSREIFLKISDRQQNLFSFLFPFRKLCILVLLLLSA